jgi:hypothetical protein
VECGQYTEEEEEEEEEEELHESTNFACGKRI